MIRIIVWVLVIFETAQMVITTRDAVRIFGPGWGDPLQLDNVGLFWLSIPIIDAIGLSSLLHKNSANSRLLRQWAT